MSEEELRDEQWQRIARYLAAESPPEERAAVERWVAADPRHAELVARLGQALDSARYTPAAGLDVEAALARVHARMDETDVVPFESARPAPTALRAARPCWTIPLRAAAAVFLLLGATVLYFALRPGSQPAVAPVAARTFQTPVGQMDTIRLDDGTTVVLAAASRLVVDARYGERERNVRLDGVAWFDVRHDPGRTFAVLAGNARIEDLGTTFAVRADPAQPVAVVVTRGSVRLALNAGGGPGVILEEGQSGRLAGGVASLDARPAGASVLAWTEGRLVFDDAPFAQVAAELRRWYGVRLVAGDSALASRHLTSEFEGEAVEAVIRIVALALDARAETRGDTVFLRSVP